MFADSAALLALAVHAVALLDALVALVVAAVALLQLPAVVQTTQLEAALQFVEVPLVTLVP